ncbi:MAG: menaquinone biosynthesis protein [Flaviaesturariibacter sp.]|nr:menaquinone biosynthesis protein [Flaviaesturariibacter sp.]
MKTSNSKRQTGSIFAPKLSDLEKIKVAAVSYLNTKPLLYGVKRHEVMQDIELIEDYPSKIAQMLIDGAVDVGLVPVAVIPFLKEYHIVTDYCIGADGPVASVCLFSEVPMEEVTKVYLDYQSRTSVMLATILLKEYWKSSAELMPAKGEDYRNEIKGTTAGLVIGDRAFEQRLHSKYIYDLADVWKRHTGLPFVFAAWISNRKLPDDFIKRFNEANAFGLEHLDEVVFENRSPYYDLYKYFSHNINYELNDSKRTALQLFLEKLSKHL